MERTDNILLIVLDTLEGLPMVHGDNIIIQISDTWVQTIVEYMDQQTHQTIQDMVDIL